MIETLQLGSQIVLRTVVNDKGKVEDRVIAFYVVDFGKWNSYGTTKEMVHINQLYWIEDKREIDALGVIPSYFDLRNRKASDLFQKKVFLDKLLEAIAKNPKIISNPTFN